MDLRFSGKLLFFYCEFLFSNTFFFFYPGEPLLPKTPHVFVPSSASSKVFGSIQELASGAELLILFSKNTNGAAWKVMLTSGGWSLKTA
jgi:hypothetical protein